MYKHCTALKNKWVLFFLSTFSQSLCDSFGQILYSLYGVVEHAGGMQGGHYTAYVRVRKTEDHTPPTSEGSVRDERCMATDGVCTKGSITEDQRETTVIDEPTTDDQRETTVVHVDEPTTDDQRETTVVDEATSMPNDDHITQNQAVGDNPSDKPPTTADQNHTTSDQPPTKATQTTTTTPLRTPSTTTETSNHRPKEFDLSSTSGQWYHISDTRVRTATQSEVDKSQAYILFYERLPLKKSF